MRGNSEVRKPTQLNSAIMGVWLAAVFLLVQLCLAGSEFQSFRARVAVDYGPRLVGLATADPFGNVKPYCTLTNTGDLGKLSREILDKARADGAIEILVGLPLDSNKIMSHRVRNFNGQLCLNFSSVLSSITCAELPRCKVLLVDESYTTREAKMRMKIERIRASLDAMSAACLLERYLEDKGEGSLEAQACSYPPPKHLEQFDYEVVRSHIRELYFTGPQSDLERKRATMQKLKDGVLKGKHHLYFSRDEERRVEAVWDSGDADDEVDGMLALAEAEEDEMAANTAAAIDMEGSDEAGLGYVRVPDFVFEGFGEPEGRGGAAAVAVDEQEQEEEEEEEEADKSAAAFLVREPAAMAKGEEAG